MDPVNSFNTRGKPEPPGPAHSLPVGFDPGGSLLRKYPWALRMKEMLSGSAAVPAEKSSDCYGTEKHEDSLRSDGASAGGSSPSGLIHPKDQPFSTLMELIRSTENPTQGMLLVAVRYGGDEARRIIKERGWHKMKWSGGEEPVAGVHPIRWCLLPPSWRRITKRG